MKFATSLSASAILSIIGFIAAAPIQPPNPSVNQIVFAIKKINSKVDTNNDKINEIIVAINALSHSGNSIEIIPVQGHGKNPRYSKRTSPEYNGKKAYEKHPPYSVPSRKIAAKSNHDIQSQCFHVETRADCEPGSPKCINYAGQTCGSPIDAVSADFMSRFEDDLFKRIDKDGNGFLSFNEYSRIMPTSKLKLEGYRKEIYEFFEKEDLNGDGFISASEHRKKSLDFNKQVPAEEIDAVFRNYDKNGDGVISAAELKLLLSKSEDVDDFESVMQETDLDGDGLISAAEFKRSVREPSKEDIDKEVEEFMHKGDVNGDDLVSFAEYEDLFVKESNERAFHEFDVDGDGQISFEEAKSMFF